MTDRETLDKARKLFTGMTQGDLLARAVIAIADKHMRLCARCKQPDDGRMSCRVDCNDCQGGGATECRRCNGAGSYLTSHMILLDDPCEGMVEI